MPRVGFEPTIAAGERPKTYALDRAATGTDRQCLYYVCEHNNNKLNVNVIGRSMVGCRMNEFSSHAAATPVFVEQCGHLWTVAKDGPPRYIKYC